MQTFVGTINLDLPLTFFTGAMLGMNAVMVTVVQFVGTEVCTPPFAPEVTAALLRSSSSEALSKIPDVWEHALVTSESLIQTNVAAKQTFELASDLTSEGMAEYAWLRVDGVRATHIAGLRLNLLVHFATQIGAMPTSVRFKNGQVGQRSYLHAWALQQFAMAATRTSLALTSSSPLATLYEGWQMDFEVFTETFVSAMVEIDSAIQACNVHGYEVARLRKTQAIGAMPPLQEQALFEERGVAFTTMAQKRCPSSFTFRRWLRTECTTMLTRS